jgi:hypothetical protein
MSKTEYIPAVFEYKIQPDLEATWYCAVPKGFVFPENFDPFKDVLEELPEGAIDLEHDYEISQRRLALMIALDEYDIDGRWEPGHCMYDTGRRSYIVATDDEADDLWDARLDSYVDEILEEFPKAYRAYFDREAWKKDAKHDGRGLSLNIYDGNEESVDIVDYTANGGKSGTTFYIYRTN